MLLDKLELELKQVKRESFKSNREWLEHLLSKLDIPSSIPEDYEGIKA